MMIITILKMQIFIKLMNNKTVFSIIKSGIVMIIIYIKARPINNISNRFKKIKNKYKN